MTNWVDRGGPEIKLLKIKCRLFLLVMQNTVCHNLGVGNSDSESLLSLPGNKFGQNYNTNWIQNNCQQRHHKDISLILNFSLFLKLNSDVSLCCCIISISISPQTFRYQLLCNLMDKSIGPVLLRVEHFIDACRCFVKLIKELSNLSSFSHQGVITLLLFQAGAFKT